MANTVCSCMPLQQAVKLVAFICILAGGCVIMGSDGAHVLRVLFYRHNEVMGFSVVTVSSWVLHKSLQERRNPTLVTATRLISQVNTFFGGTTGLYDLHIIFRILIICSATALMGGVVQFFMSLWLLVASAKRARVMAAFWVVIQIIVMMAIGGSFLCIMTNELEINLALKIFLGVTGLDFALLVYFSWVVFAYSRGPNSDL